MKGSNPMKTVRFLLALVILLSMNSLSASAQAGATTSFAYISLLPANPVVSSGEGSSLPVEMLSQQAYTFLLPDLLMAQRQGVIVKFEPDFFAGLVKLEYTAGADLAALLGDQFSIFTDPATIAQYVRSYARKPGGPSGTPAATTPQFHITPHANIFYGFFFPADRYLKITLTDAGGKLMSVATAWTDPSGFFWTYFSWGTWTGMEPGYNFTAKMYLLDKTTLVKTFKTTIPKFAITSIDIPSKTVKGTAPASKSIEVELVHRNLDAGGGYTYVTNYPVASATGLWQTTFTTAMRGADYIEAAYLPNANFVFLSYTQAPFISTQMDSNYGWITGAPNAAASMTIRHAGVDHIFNGKFSRFGDFYAELLDAGGAPVFLQAGDKISGSSVTSLLLPTLTATVDPATDIVSGSAPASKYLYVYIYLRTDCGGYSCWNGYGYYLKSTVAGTFSANFSGIVDILSTDTLRIEVEYINPGTGNMVFYSKLISP